ncbi:antibiotic biosynthesis monooxygenase family protein [Xanthocytophaga agilis]|uniref:Antibiotic biosynthesis monooxygenase family protein n=1 Tax=Xanthocytophaga agilis TaxID=3048010 RepID=A0AAE3UGZ4_9BACT|nr:antibiotic biosynthesis monooxygenase family protein [Xanthocytophaga agilis]MDJ1505498.1 antibiotic biosynthesis monooxygenase family protein [Xanthocytophaga agilis]
MLVRIVRMTFQIDKVADFHTIFRQSQPIIRSFPGCLHVELLQDADNPVIYSTLSHWENAAALEAYRQSDFFRDTWSKTKILFSDKPIAFSLYPVTIS